MLLTAATLYLVTRLPGLGGETGLPTSHATIAAPVPSACRRVGQVDLAPRRSSSTARNVCDASARIEGYRGRLGVLYGRFTGASPKPS